MLLVLFAVAIAAALSLTFVAGQATSTGIRQNLDHHGRARAIAESAVDLVEAEIKSNANWRTSFTAGQWSAAKTLNGGTYRINFPSLSGTTSQPLNFTVEATYGGVAHRTGMQLVPQPMNGDVLMIHTSDPAGMTAADEALSSLIFAWGWQVIPMADNAAAATMKAAADDADAVYITPSVNANNLSGKLTATDTGLITHESLLAGQWGIVPTGTSSTSVTAKKIRVLNASHYITRTLATGDVDVLTANAPLKHLANPTGVTAMLLAAQNGDSNKPFAATLERGSAMASGGTSVGRRVFLPWTSDPSLYTDAGRTLIKRAIEWCAMEPPSTPGPISYWKLDETSGTVAADTTSLSNGTLRNGAVVNQTGKLAKAIKFDGTNDYIDITHKAGYLLNEGSVAFWFKLDNVTKRHELFSKDGSGFGNGGHFSIWANTTGIYARIEDKTSTYTVSKTSALTANAWHHVTVTFGSTGFRLYLDGINVASHLYAGGLGTSSGGSGNTQPIVLGANMAASGAGVVSGLTDFLQGLLDDIRIYDRALESNEISQLASGAETITVASTATYGLVGKDGITFGNDSVVDSYDSSAGAYSAATAGSAATLATNATTADKVMLYDRTDVNGHINVGVGAAAGTVIKKVSGAQYDSASSLTGPVSVPVTTVPGTSGAYPVSSLYMADGQMEFPLPGTYYFTGDMTALNYTYIVRKPVAVILRNANFTNVKVVVADAGSVTFYIAPGCNVTFGNSTKFNVTTTAGTTPGDPSLFKVYKVGAGTVSFGNNVLVSGQFYGTETPVTAGNDCAFYGILQAKSLNLGARFKFHHDLHIELYPETVPSGNAYSYVLRWTDQR